MKRLIAVVLILGLLVLGGCSSQWYEHDTVYKTNQHMWFSLGGYQSADQGDWITQTYQGGWWGESIEIVD